jgi:predicted RNase H-like HicB family nuclease
MKRYAVVIEKMESGYGAFVPDLPGCVAAGDTYEETTQLIREAIPFHIEGMRASGEAIPGPTTRIEFVDAESAA